MQNTGTLTDLALPDLLESVQKDRATGTLTLRSEGREATLYFLFGHLFHALGEGTAGEAVVHDTLGWDSGDFTFDAKAKLPAEETIKASTTELLEAWMGNGSSGPAEPEAIPEAEAEEPAIAIDEAMVMAPEAEPEPEAPAEVEAVAEPEVEPAAEADLTPLEFPEAAHPMRRRTDREPDVRAPETMALYPMPMGKLIYESLTAGFVDFPKLLRSLAKDGHTGYVRLSADSFTGLLLFASGSVVEAIYDDGRVSTGKAAFGRFGDHIDEGDGVLDVIQLSAEMVTALYQLLTARGLYEKLLARFVKVDALIEHLHETGVSGALIVRPGEGFGIVLFREGQVLGAYTDAAREAGTDAGRVLELCADPGAQIEVRGGPVPATLPVLDPSGGGPDEVPSGSPAGDGPAAAPKAPVAKPKPAPAPEPEPAPVAEATPPRPVVVAEPAPPVAVAPPPALADEAPADDVDWGEIVNRMAARADEVLGTRSKKVKEMLYATPQNSADIAQTLDRIAELSIMFVDPAKLTALADDMRGMTPAA